MTLWPIPKRDIIREALNTFFDCLSNIHSQLIIIQFLDITRVSPVRMTMMPRIIPPKLIVASIFHGCVRQAHNIMFFFKTYLEVEQSLESLVKST